MEVLNFSKKEKRLFLMKKCIPTIKDPDEILIKVAFSGICGTDLHIIGGEFPVNEERPVALGHEFCGTVVEVGPAVKNIWKDDKVAVDPNLGCYICDYCRVGKPHFCENASDYIIGIFKDGGWAEFCVVPEKQVFKLPNSIPLQQAALCEPLSCVAHGLELISPIRIGQKILITGTGIIGNLWISILHLQGHRNVTVVEPNSTRLCQVKKLDTGYELVTPDDLKGNALKNPCSYKFDLVIDCSGCAAAIEHAATLLNIGGKLVIFGVAPPDAKISLSPYDIFKRELTIMGTVINPFSLPNAIKLIECLGERYLDYDKLGIKTFALSDYDSAIDHLKKGSIAKAMFKF